jgi:hypothetical protein
MSIKTHLSSITITTSLFLLVSTPVVHAQQAFGGVSFSGVGAAVLGCSGATDFLAEATAKLKQNVLALKGTSYLGFEVGTVQETNDEGQQLQSKKGNKKESCKDPIAYALGTSLMNSFIDDTINWATTGFNGTPYFVRNQDSFFENMAREEKQRFLNALPSTNDVYGNAIRYAMIAKETGRTASRSALRGENDAASQEIEDFTNDFKKGGWTSFFTTTQTNARNPIGAFFEATEQQAINREKIIQEKTGELMKSGGFLDQKKCVEWNYLGEENGDFSEQSLENYVLAGRNSEPVCVKEEVVTPGKIIAEQTARATQAASERALQADELNEQLGRFLDRMLSNLANKGLAALTTPKTKLIQSGPNASVAPNRTITDVQNSFDESEFTITNPKHLQGLIKAQKDYLSVLRDSRIAAEESLAGLGALDYCVPGPNANMTQLASQNMRSIVSGLQDGYVRKRFLSRKDYRQLQPLPFIVENPIAEGDFSLNSPIFINEYVDDDDEKGVFVDNIQNKSVTYFELFNEIFTKEKIISFFENAQTTQQDRDMARGTIQSILLETRKLPEYGKNMKTALATYDQTAEIVDENIIELESIHRQILGIVKIARERHIAEQRALGVTVNLECLDIQYSTRDPIIAGRIRRESDTPSTSVQTLRDAEKAFFSPRSLYRNHNLPFWNDL